MFSYELGLTCQYRCRDCLLLCLGCSTERIKDLICVESKYYLVGVSPTDILFFPVIVIMDLDSLIVFGKYFLIRYNN